jgi:hypothetical protein
LPPRAAPLASTSFVHLSPRRWEVERECGSEVESEFGMRSILPLPAEDDRGNRHGEGVPRHRALTMHFPSPEFSHLPCSPPLLLASVEKQRGEALLVGPFSPARRAVGELPAGRPTQHLLVQRVGGRTSTSPYRIRLSEGRREGRCDDWRTGSRLSLPELRFLPPIPCLDSGAGPHRAEARLLWPVASSRPPRGEVMMQRPVG